MDPNANIDEQDAILTGPEPDNDRLQELREALQGWISNGGFFPDAERQRTPAWTAYRQWARKRVVPLRMPF